VTLDPDVVARPRHSHRPQRGMRSAAPRSEILNSTVRAGLASGPGAARAYRLSTARLELRPGLDLDRALRLAAAMEDDEVVRKLELRK
jgi:hypothetical protein